VTEPILRTENLVRRFEGATAVDGVSFAVNRGEFRAVIGPNGAGKTTLFNLLTGNLRSHAGRIVFDGRDVTRMPPHRRCHLGVGRTFQINNIFPDATVFQNIQLAVLSHHGRIWSLWQPSEGLMGDEVKAAAEQVGLLSHLHKKGAELSYGDRRKLELAIAIVSKPSLLLLDEPTCGMSLSERLPLIEMVRRIVDRDGLTAVLIEHDMDVVFSVADCITVLHRGKVIANAPPQTIADHDEVQRVYLGEAVRA
jgi:branched-chain amino acid transport system ATP-binding protein